MNLQTPFADWRQNSRSTPNLTLKRGLAVLLGSLLAAQVWAAPVEEDFQAVTLVEGLNLPMEFEISRDGRIFVVAKCGAFYAWNLDDGTPTQTSTLPDVRCEFEDGLLSIALDPDFTQNSFVYLQYSAPGSVTRVSRFVVNPDNSLDLTSESVLLEWYSDEAAGHMGGTMTFDLDGNLIITTGDNKGATGHFSSAAEETSGNTNDLRGKVLRITPTPEGSYTIPEGNLFAGDTLHRPEIYAMGFRNPFRGSVDPLTGYFYLGDIGPDASTESEEGPIGLDELNAIDEAGNYGWPYIVGFNQPYPGFDPDNLVNNHPNNSGATQLPDAVPAMWTIMHRAIMAGPVYRSDENIDNEFKLPEYYDGHLIFWDFNSSNFFAIDLNDTTSPPIEEPFPINTTGFLGPIDVELDPRTHQLYVLEWGSGCCDHSPYDNGAITRFDHIGGRDNGTNVASDGMAYASTENGDFLAAYAIDGDPETRWESAWSDPQWLRIELAQATAIDSIRVVWEAAYSSEFEIEASVDANNWDVLASVNDGSGGTQLFVVDSQTEYRYVRLTGTARGTDFGHSIFEFEVYAQEEEDEPAPLPEHAYLNLPQSLDADFTGVPRLLSETGAFSDTTNMVPAEHLIPYEPNSQLWSDRAFKARWLSLPAGTVINWDITQNWQFPAGTVAVKHFELPLDENTPSLTKRLETRLIVMQPNGRVYGVTYKWREDNSDADLLMDAFSEDIDIIDANGESWTQTWTYPSPSQCLSCHNSDSSQILGVNTRQLNGYSYYPGIGLKNQMVHLNDMGLLSPRFVSSDVTTFDTMAAITDESASLETRVKSYIDANCAHCHGTGQGGSEWDARFNTPLDDMSIVDSPTTGIRDYSAYYGIDDAKLVDPGRPYHSILYLRDKSVDPDDRMPPIGRSLEDTQYLAVLEAWIESLGDDGDNPDDGDPSSPEETPGSEGKAVITSSGDADADNMVDGDAQTVWQSAPSNRPWVQIDLESHYYIEQILLDWGAQHSDNYVVQASKNGTTWTTILVQDNGTGGIETYDNPTGAYYRYIRLISENRVDEYVISLSELKIFGVEVPASLNQPVQTSTDEAETLAAYAVDGNPDTLWSSEFAQDQWIEVDLQSPHELDRIVLAWEATYQSGYQIEGSLDRSNWTTLVTQSNASSCLETHMLTGAYRYVRVRRTASAEDWGYALWELAIYGHTESTAVTPSTPSVPQIEVVSPMPAQEFAAGSDVSLSVSISGDEDWFANGGSYSYSLDGGTAVNVAAPGTVNLGVLNSGDHIINVQLVDAGGQGLGDTATVSFSVAQADTGGNTGTTGRPVLIAPVAAEASSSTEAARSGEMAIDGDEGTRWESEFSDPQYLQLDLGETTYISRVVLTWEAAYGKSYTLDVSDDATNWQTVYSTDQGDGGIDDITLQGEEGRYIRMSGTERGTGYGYSLFEVEVYGLVADDNVAMIDLVSPMEQDLFTEGQNVLLEVALSDETWITNGGGYNYYLNDNDAVTVTTLDPVNLGSLPIGPHSIRVELVDSEDTEVSIPKSSDFTVLCGVDCPEVLAFSATEGFRHDSIGEGLDMIQDLAQTYGYGVTASEDASLFTEENLAQYSTVVFVNTTGDILNASQEAAFRAYIEGGGGFVGMHSAADTEHDWDWYTNTLLGGAEFEHHGDGIPTARVAIEQMDDPIVSHIGAEWILDDEWYFFLNNPRDSATVDVLGTLDRSSYDSNYPVTDHPIIFKNTVSQGRAFYTAIGHVADNFSDPNMVEMIRQAIEWTSGK